MELSFKKKRTSKAPAEKYKGPPLESIKQPSLNNTANAKSILESWDTRDRTNSGSIQAQNGSSGDNSGSISD